MTVVRLAYNPGPIDAYGALSGCPAVRLAYHPEGDRTLSDCDAQPMSVRQSYGNSPPERNGTSGLEGTAVRLAVAPHAEKGGANSVEHHVTAGGLGARNSNDKDLLKPALLVSYVYLEPFLKNQSKYAYRDWVLDSGAFSAYQSGTEIDLQQYIDTCKRLLSEDPTLTEVYSLDVIGDYKASLTNTEKMWKQGVEAIPCFHVGSPESELKAIAKDYPKIALGGAALMTNRNKKFDWAEQCFARVWPKKIHGFAFSGEQMVMGLPWHSVDATSWEMGPCGFGNWKTFGKMSVRGSRQNLRVEVEWYLNLERRARARWKKEMQLLESL